MTMNMPPTVSPQEWKAAREELLLEEKELTHARDALAAKRRRMPRMAVEKDYEFEGPHGPASLLVLFEGRRQLIVYRFFFEPGVHGWPESGCPRLLLDCRSDHGIWARASSLTAKRSLICRWLARGALAHRLSRPSTTGVRHEQDHHRYQHLS